jgi:hypothetical protein
MFLLSSLLVTKLILVYRSNAAYFLIILLLAVLPRFKYYLSVLVSSKR